MKSRRHKVYVAPMADRKLVSHLEFLSRVSLLAAEHLYIAYEKALGFLAETPASCPLYTLLQPIGTEIRYKLFGKRYRIVFEIIADTVYIYDIQDCRQNINKNLI